ncbi:uncharacterized protein [Coffea arabica]|uniref:Tf2-1-like SH3-like domain-containing protein n=1 Tax=Coffea arabica TaxID=13443 RepID=A0A6P6SNU2_COFAR|nr:uncharacterized protein LOC113693183 [Coffea arabica]
MSPFEALYGIPSPQLALGPYTHPKVATVEDHLKDRQKLDELLKRNLQEAQDRMKLYADQKRSARTFSVGDWVYLKLQPHRQTTVELRGNTKLSAKYFGPYQVIQKIRKIAYRLKLPKGSKIHPVFHVYLLKKNVGNNTTPVLQLPNVDEKGHLRVEPVAILDRRIVRKKNAAAVQWLIH